MKRVELYGRVRHAVMIEGLSQREAARCFGIDPRTVRKMLSYSVPPGYVRTRPPVRPKLDPFIGIIDRILEEDKDRPKKQRHTSKRIFERLRDEYGFTGKITIVKDYICGVRQRRREMFVPLTHPPGHAQVDFGEALAVIGGVERKIHFLAMSPAHARVAQAEGNTLMAASEGWLSRDSNSVRLLPLASRSGGPQRRRAVKLAAGRAGSGSSPLFGRFSV